MAQKDKLQISLNADFRYTFIELNCKPTGGAGGEGREGSMGKTPQEDTQEKAQNSRGQQEVQIKKRRRRKETEQEQAPAFKNHEDSSEIVPSH